ncbi:MAG: SLBB domain-containing protein [Melioribacteraceae bacterium]|nr:SLBB domain-containing protein [Melioribacteraceae bacterium]
MKFKILILSILLSITLFAQDMSDLQQSSMYALNKISVTIGGDFITNGTFPASATERVDEFVTRIYNQYRLALLTTTKDAQSLARLRNEIDEYAERGIVLKHTDGTDQIIDLQKFRLTANYSENPYLLNGDVLIFPQLDWQRNFIEIEGAVNKPTQFQFVEGDHLSDAILFSRGINSAYENIDKIEITRLSYDGMNEEIIPATIKENPILKRGDRIRVVSNETQKRDFKVLIGGEVNKPGYIYITKDQTTIKEVIEKAGGFKENADLISAELIRRNALTNSASGSNAPFQNRRRSFNLTAFNRQTDLLMMNRMADIEPEDSLSLITDNQLRLAKSLVTVDFKEVLNDNSDNSKFIVKDGDIIYIPEITDLVYVYGQVMNPGFIDYVEGNNYQHYIRKAGGVGNAAKSEVYLIKGKTRAYIDMTDDDYQYTIESGDYIWVPKDIPRTFDFYLTRTARIAAVVAAVATVYLAFKP